MKINDVAPVVYIIDDDPLILETLRTLVESVGIRSKLFNNAQDFLQAYTPFPKECVVSDMRMPGLSGIQLQKALQERTQVPPPFILITGHGEISSAVEAMKQGAFDYVEKPVAGQLFLDKIQAALSHSGKLHHQRLAESAKAAQLALLTPKENQVLSAVLEGLSSKDIADQLSLSIRTIENHRARIMDKLHVKSTIELVKRFSGEPI